MYNVPRQVSQDQTAAFHGVRKGSGSFCLVKIYKSQGSWDCLAYLSILVFVLSWETLIKPFVWLFVFRNCWTPQKWRVLESWARNPCCIHKYGHNFGWLDSVFSWYMSLSTPVQQSLGPVYGHIHIFKIIRIIKTTYFSCSDLGRPVYILGRGGL